VERTKRSEERSVRARWTSRELAATREAISMAKARADSRPVISGSWKREWGGAMSGARLR
jgi:hypothetical protein